MKESSAIFKALACVLFLLVLTTIAQAQATRTWVAGTGNDANPCTLALPCGTFAAAILQTAAGGEINVKNAGEFGYVRIDKSITIDGGGTFSGILSGLFFLGVFIDDSTSATPNTAVVTLRNLSINGAGAPGAPPGTGGVYFVSGKTLNIENCRISNFSWAGVSIILQGYGNVNIKNTNIFNSHTGVLARTSFGLVTVSVIGCNIEQNTSEGVAVQQSSMVSISDSVVQFNGVGVSLQGLGATINIFDSQINHNTMALSVPVGMLATIGSSTFMDNTTDFLNNSIIKTFRNNQTASTLPGLVTNLNLQ